MSDINLTLEERATCVYIIGRVNGDDASLSATRSLYERLCFTDEEMAEAGISKVSNGVFSWQPSSSDRIYKMSLVASEIAQLRTGVVSWPGWSHETWDSLQALKEKLTI